MSQFSTYEIDFISKIGEMISSCEVVTDSTFLEIVGGDQFDIEGLEQTLLALDNLADYVDINSDDPSAWKFNFNKDFFKERDSFYFSSQELFNNWLVNQDPFESNFLLNQDCDCDKILVIINGLSDIIQGNKLVFAPPSKLNEIPKTDSLELPTNTDIKKETHVISSNIFIEPSNFHLVEFIDTDWCKKVIEYYIRSLAYCLANEIRSPDSIVIQGIKRVEINITDFPNQFDQLTQLASDLEETIQWAYEERTQTRLKLICNRLSLDLSVDQSFFEELAKSLPHAYKEAREKYGFIINEISDDFNKEQREIQIQILDISKLFSEKLRTLLSGILRDILAAVFLAAFGVFINADLTKLEASIHNRYIWILFKGLAVYFLLSIVLQTISNFFDIRLSKEELNRYATTTRNYLNTKEVKKMIRESLSNREYFFAAFYLMIFIGYCILAWLCWNLESIIKLFL